MNATAPPFDWYAFAGWLLLVLAALTAWRLAVLGYGAVETLALLPLDAALCAVLLWAALGNPLANPGRYSTVYLAFAVLFMWENTPGTLFGWLGAMVVLGLLWGLAPVLFVVGPTVAAALMIALVAVRMVLPLHYRDLAAGHLGQSPHRVGRECVAAVGDHWSFVLAREKFRWYLAEDARGWRGQSRARRLHAAMRRAQRDMRVYHVDFDDLRSATVSRTEDRVSLRYGGLLAGLLRDEAHRPPGAISARHRPASLLPTVELLVGPFDVELVRSTNGRYFVSALPATVPMRPTPAQGPLFPDITRAPEP